MKWSLLALICGLLAVSQALDKDDGRFLARRTTKTQLILTTTTVEVPLTCALFTSTAVCQRRRYRRYNIMSENLDKIDDKLSDSADTLTEESWDGDEGNNRHQKLLALTLISTTVATFTVTSSSVNPLTTFSLSYFCTAANAVVPPAC
ncbi:hypothetical protein Hamer_G020189 [Homarus americanus]|uniref:Uncharacterized protein n=1 Tax=Homarus americanus TaxID=6706 RepID=A0A8J5K7K9_HOMAM|nr:hypothetical protein Hamer_G020189 [Homarus americanus]